MNKLELPGKLAVSLDFDGPVFPRFPAQLEVLRPWNYGKPLSLHSPIRWEDRLPEERPLTRGEFNEITRHAKRAVKPEVAYLINQTDVPIFGNTGRYNHISMVTVTLRELEKAGIRDKFVDVLFKPHGVESDEGKYWGIREMKDKGYTNIVHYDDNARTVRRLAQALHDVRFVIVQDLTSGILFSLKEMKKFPNVARIAISKNAQVEVVYMPLKFGEFPLAA